MGNAGYTALGSLLCRTTIPVAKPARYAGTDRDSLHQFAGTAVLSPGHL